MKPGAILLAQIQQADGRLKPRPVLVLAWMPPYSDLLVCAISSKLKHMTVGFDDVIEQGDPDFAESGLKVSSLVRLGLLATIPSGVVMGRLGSVTNSRLQGLRERLAEKIRSCNNPAAS